MVCMGKESNACMILVRKPKGKNAVGRSRCRREDYITMYLKDTDLERLDWVDVASDSLKWRDVVTTVMNILFS